MRTSPARSLYVKLFVWIILNALLLVSIGIIFFVWLLFGSSEGLFPPHIFSSKAEGLCRTISADLQYRPFEKWGHTVEVYDKQGKYQLAMMGLGKGQIFYTAQRIPEEKYRTLRSPSVRSRTRFSIRIRGIPLPMTCATRKRVWFPSLQSCLKKSVIFTGMGVRCSFRTIPRCSTMSF